MLYSTETLIEDSMQMNADIQEDNLCLLEMHFKLKKDASLLVKLTDIDKAISNNFIPTDKVIAFLDDTFDFSNIIKLDKNKYSALDNEAKSSYMHSLLNAYISKAKGSIVRSLTSMLNASINDIDRKYVYNKVNNRSDNKILSYHRYAIENLTLTIKKTIDYFTNPKTESTEALGKDLYNNLSMLHTQVYDNGYVSINLPPPKNQTMEEAELDTNLVNEASDRLNTLIDKQTMSKLFNLTTSISNAVDKNPIGAVDYYHKLSQMIMSLKNSLLLMKNYHKVTVQELAK